MILLKGYWARWVNVHLLEFRASVGRRKSSHIKEPIRNLVGMLVSYKYLGSVQTKACKEIVF